MPRILGRFLAVVLIAGGLTALWSAPAMAAACPRGTGVTVVVNNDVRCAAMNGGNARTAFGNVGHSFQDAVRSPGFVCRINGVPANDPCINVSPTDAYWGLFWSDGTSGTWSYSNIGANGLNVGPGGWVAFVFQNSHSRTLPSMSPVAPAPPTPTPSTPATGGSGTGDSAGSSSGATTGSGTAAGPGSSSSSGSSNSTGGAVGSAGGSSSGASGSSNNSNQGGGANAATGTNSASGSTAKPDSANRSDGEETPESSDEESPADDEPTTEAVADNGNTADDGSTEDTGLTATSANPGGSNALVLGWAAAAIVLIGLAGGVFSARRRRGTEPEL